MEVQAAAAAVPDIQVGLRVARGCKEMMVARDTYTGGQCTAGGGGGKGTAGGNAIPFAGGNGGDGFESDISGENKYYAAGGGGGVNETSGTPGTGGSSIGGNGSVSGNGSTGVANTGSGGGGARGGDPGGHYGGNGGSGIVIVRYALSTPTLDAPSGVSASDGTYSNLVRITWSTVTNALYYELWRNTSNNSASASVLAQTTYSVTYDDATVTAGVSYCYWIKAKNAQATSAFSDSDSGYAAPSSVSGYANLEVSDVILLPTTLSVSGHPGAAGLQLVNWGPSDMTTPNTRVILDFFLSKNTTFGDADDLWLGDYKTDVTLSAGSYTLVAVTASAREGFTVPSGAVGTNYVFARARHTYPSTLGDNDESNNHAMRTGTISVTGTNGVPSAGYHLINDYDGDGKSDFAFYKEVTGEWLIMFSGSGYAPVQFILGGKDYQPVIADYDGDGKADPAVCNQKTGEWKAMLSASGSSMITFTFVGHAYTPVPIDYDRDGKADPAIYQQSGAWILLLSGSGYAAQTMTLGGNTYVPVPADYDGDGISDLAVYRLSTGDWMLKLSTLDYWTVEFRLGGSGSIPVPADYDGDGKTDPAVYKESSGYWSFMMSRFGYLTASGTFGGQGWVPVAADYDGDGKEDIAIYNDKQHLLKMRVSGSYYGLITLDVGGPGYEPVGWPR